MVEWLLVDGWDMKDGGVAMVVHGEKRESVLGVERSDGALSVRELVGVLWRGSRTGWRFCHC